jgi:hypothetical protein
MSGGLDMAVELQRIYDSEINISMNWMWDGGVRVRVGDEIGGYIAEEIVEKVADALPWFQEAIAHFYPTSEYARGLSADIRERAARRVFTLPRVGASANCPHCGAPNAVPVMDELLAFNCLRCGKFVKVRPPAVQ